MTMDYCCFSLLKRDFYIITNLGLLMKSGKKNKDLTRKKNYYKEEQIQNPKNSYDLDTIKELFK